MLQLLLQKAIELIKYDQESGVTAIESINELVESHPKFIKPIFKDMLMIYTEIMAAPGLLNNLRSSSMYGVLLLAMNHAAVMRKSDYFKTNMVPTYMKMLSEHESISEEEWSNELNEEVISKNDISKSTEEHLAQLQNELGNKFMLPLFIPLITKAIMSNEVAAQHAGLTAMAILIENCHESYKKELDNVMKLIGTVMETKNARLIYDILVAMGYMSE